jgi:protein-S-isoprenylcysteine O-methyltransferase Ste14
MQKLELKVPPVLLFLLAIVAMVVLNRTMEVTVSWLPVPWLVCAVCFAAAGYFGLRGIYEFKKAKTTVHPVDVHKTTTVVVSGVYKLSRNPMYFGLLLLLFALAYWQQDLLSALVCPLFVLYMNRFQIEPEERHLEQRFGEPYVAYKHKVRRWI